MGERFVDCVLEGAGGLQALEELGLLLPQKIRGVAGAQGERRALAQVQANPAVGALGGAAEPAPVKKTRPVIMSSSSRCGR